MQCVVRLFVIPADRVPAGRPMPANKIEVEAACRDGLRKAAATQVTAEGYRIRSISFGPEGLLVYAEEQP